VRQSRYVDVTYPSPLPTLTCSVHPPINIILQVQKTEGFSPCHPDPDMPQFDRSHGPSHDPVCQPHRLCINLGTLMSLTNLFANIDMPSAPSHRHHPPSPKDHEGFSPCHLDPDMSHFNRSYGPGHNLVYAYPSNFTP